MKLSILIGISSSTWRKSLRTMAAGELSHHLGSTRHLHHLDDVSTTPFLASDEPCARHGRRRGVGLDVRRNASALGHHPTPLVMGGVAAPPVAAGLGVRLLDRPAVPTSRTPPWLPAARALPGPVGARCSYLAAGGPHGGEAPGGAGVPPRVPVTAMAPLAGAPATFRTEPELELHRRHAPRSRRHLASRRTTSPPSVAPPHQSKHGGEVT
jgi:hypothetical protein